MNAQRTYMLILQDHPMREFACRALVMGLIVIRHKEAGDLLLSYVSVLPALAWGSGFLSVTAA